MDSFELVKDFFESDIEYTIPLSLAKELESIHTSILKGEPMVHQLKMLRQRYPQAPQILNLMSVAYVNKKDFIKAYEINQEAYRLYPEYIFARVNMANEFLNKDEM